MINIAVVGSRNYPRMCEVKEYLNSLIYHLPDRSVNIITGGAVGVDKEAENWALKKGVCFEVIRPVDPKDKFSYLLRNVEIITKADYIVIFWDGISKGTKFVIDYCNQRGLNYLVSKVKE